MKALAFVVPWYGDILGGAEHLCRGTAEHLAAAGVPVEVLTTTARDLFGGWSVDAHRPGTTVEGGVTVRRFALDKEPLVAYGTINARLMAGERVGTTDELRWLRESVNSAGLNRAIAEAGDRVCLFLPYLFGTTYHGVQVAPDRSWLIPCLHDEGYARMSVLPPVFQRVKGMICLSAPERDLVRQYYGVEDARLWGAGVDTPPVGDADRFRARTGITGPFLLYVGRRDATKNVPLLVEYFCRYLMANPELDLSLVLAGRGEVQVPRRFADRVHDIGPVDDATKADAYAAALALCQPSVHESFSYVIMEAWLQGTPSLVHAQCGPTREHTLAASGGLPFGSFAEFAGAVDYLRDHPDTRRRMGDCGRRYVLANFQWPRMVERYARLLG